MAGSFGTALPLAMLLAVHSLGMAALPLFNPNIVAGGTAVIALPVSGPGITFEWSKAGTGVLADGSRISGAAKRQLVVKGFTADDEGDHSCKVGLFGSDATVGPFHLHLLKKPSSTSDAPGKGVVSVAFSWQLTSSEPATTFVVVGLPSGLRYDARTNLVTGTPNIAGTFPVKVTPRNAAGAGTTKVFTLTIDGLDKDVASSYRGLVDLNADIDSDLGCSIAFTVTSSGTLTGRLYLGRAASYPLAGRFSVVLGGQPTYDVTIARRGNGPLVMSLTFRGSYGGAVGTLKAGAASTPVKAMQPFLAPVGVRNQTLVSNAALAPKPEDAEDLS